MSAVRRRVIVIGGGVSDEHEVSLASAAGVVAALTERGEYADLLRIDRDGGWADASGHPIPASDAVARLTRCDVAFPVLHGVHGEDGAIAGFLDLIGVPFVGSPLRAGALTIDKQVTKTLVGAMGVPIAGGGVCTAESAEELAASLGFPVVVKPTDAGSSNGVSVAVDAQSLTAAIALARRAGDTIMIESFVEGREIDIAVFRDASGRLVAGAPLEIAVADGSVFDRDTKYDGSARFTVPAPLTAPQLGRLRESAVRLYDAFGCAGVARFDYFFTGDEFVLNEINTSPGMTAQSQVPRMFAAVGIEYPDLLDAMVDAALYGPHSTEGLA